MGGGVVLLWCLGFMRYHERHELVYDVQGSAVATSSGAIRTFMTVRLLKVDERADGASLIEMRVDPEAHMVDKHGTSHQLGQEQRLFDHPFFFWHSQLGKLDEVRHHTTRQPPLPT